VAAGLAHMFGVQGCKAETTTVYASLQFLCITDENPQVAPSPRVFEMSVNEIIKADFERISRREARSVF